MWISLPPTIMAALYARYGSSCKETLMAAMPDLTHAKCIKPHPALKDEIHGRLRSILDAPDTGTARFLLKQTLAAYEDKAGKAMGVLESGFDDATAVLMLPERYRKRLRTTNSVERLNEEVRRRERVIRIFPNRESVIRLIGALLMEQDEK
ncbi:transposase [Paenibacillus larvae]|nr:transposase [Paenibacillus larvae]MDT2255181.1 transposase [Paenibacillus larvae]